MIIHKVNIDNIKASHIKDDKLIIATVKEDQSPTRKINILTYSISEKRFLETEKRSIELEKPT